MGMISYEEIRQLQQYQSGPDSFILSLYVNVDQSNATNLNRGFETRAENVFRQIAESQAEGENHKQRLDVERNRVLIQVAASGGSAICKSSCRPGAAGLKISGSGRFSK
jgi:GTPase SAR1 family protein